MNIISQGSLGTSVRNLSNNIALDKKSVEMILISDFFNPKWCLENVTVHNPSRYIYIFLTNQGLFVSPILSSSGPCISCLTRFWFANISIWEHPLSFEKSLIEIGSYKVPLRDKFMVEIASRMALELLAETMDGKIKQGHCSYFDIQTAELIHGYLAPLTECKCCGNLPQSGERRYIQNLNNILSKII